MTAPTLGADVDLSICAHCEERMPVCVGRYESSDNPVEPACDECCGHGNEDGWCEPIGVFLQNHAALSEADRESLEWARRMTKTTRVTSCSMCHDSTWDHACDEEEVVIPEAVRFVALLDRLLGRSAT